MTLTGLTECPEEAGEVLVGRRAGGERRAEENPEGRRHRPSQHS